jgi:2-haloalkanoic acid dehalogenase type II
VTDERFDLVTFDCYGTLVDWDSGISAAFEPVARGAEVTVGDLRTAYEEIEPVVEAEPYRPYRDVLAETARRAAARFGIALDDGRARAFADSLPSWRPFPDANPALERLRDAGYRLGILSNTDEDLIARTCGYFTVAFDPIITAEAVRSYKPSLDHFHAVRSRFGNLRWLHVAQSHFHDIAPTHDLGVPNVWINRQSESLGARVPPDREFTSLAELAAWLSHA